MEDDGRANRSRGEWLKNAKGCVASLREHEVTRRAV
jgi:hypothetical protein